MFAGVAINISLILEDFLCAKPLGIDQTIVAYISFCYSRVRFHYGHPDIFDRIFHITRGGVCKASKIINLSEDIFAGKL